jgi:hypothetical protein
MNLILMHVEPPRLRCPKCGTSNITIHNHDDPMIAPGEQEPDELDAAECNRCDHGFVRKDAMY